MIDPEQKGREFEDDLAKEFGLKPVPGSGNQWHSKLDLVGRIARWSLKYRAKSFTLTRDFIDESISATEGFSGTGEIPVWAIRLGDPEYDLIILRKDDFKLWEKGELKLVDKEITRGEARRQLARVPILLRDSKDLKPGFAETLNRVAEFREHGE